MQRSIKKTEQPICMLCLCKAAGHFLFRKTFLFEAVAANSMRRWQRESFFLSSSSSRFAHKQTHKGHYSWRTACMFRRCQGQIQQRRRIQKKAKKMGRRKTESIWRAQRPWQNEKKKKQMWIERDFTRHAREINTFFNRVFRPLPFTRPVLQRGICPSSVDPQLPINRRQAFPAVWHTVSGERDVLQ